MSNHRSHNNNISTRVSTFHQPPTSDHAHNPLFLFTLVSGALLLPTSDVTVNMPKYLFLNHYILKIVHINKMNIFEFREYSVILASASCLHAGLLSA